MTIQLSNTRKEMCEERTTRMQADIGEIKNDVKELLRRNDGGQSGTG